LHSVATQTQLTSSYHKQEKQQKKGAEEERLIFDGHVRRMEGRQLPGPAGRRKKGQIAPNPERRHNGTNDGARHA
jgi:hypothetical protein